MEKTSRIFFDSLDGVRSLSCLGIVLMHVAANASFGIAGNFIFDKFIPSLTWLVYLFMMVSSFGMCAGYLDGFVTGSVDLEKFYIRRYLKVVPFFASLLVLSILLDPSPATVYEAVMEVTMLHGLLPNNNLSTIGVAWFLGVVFLFYLVFPAFCILLKTKRRAVCSFVASLLLSYTCQEYFFSSTFVTESFIPRHSFLYCLPFFFAGSLIYIFRDQISDFCLKKAILVKTMVLIVVPAWFLIPDSGFVLVIKSLCTYSLFLSAAISIGENGVFLRAKTFKKISSISLELYLFHMVAFRAVEKMGLLYCFGVGGALGWASLLNAFALTMVIAVAAIGMFRKAELALAYRLSGK